MLELLAILAVFTSASLLAVSVLWHQEDPIAERVRGLRRQRPVPPPDLARPFSDRIILPALSGVARIASAVLPNRILEEVRRKLLMGGNTKTLNAFLIEWTLLTILPPALFLLLVILPSGGMSGNHLVILLALAALGAIAPYYLLVLKIRRRQKTIWKSLPDAFDLIMTSVEAGLGLDAALGRVAQKTPGPFADELNITLREVVMGRPRRDALMDLATRTGVQDLSTFVNAVIQAEQMGVSIGQVLRVQSDQLRTRRKQRAEQAGRRAAILLIFPIVVFNLPALFLVAIGPAAIEIFDSIGTR